MTAMQIVNQAVQESVDTVGGAARVVTSPLAERSTSQALDRFVKERVGQLVDGVLIIPSTAAIYTLYTDNRDGSVFWRMGKGLGWGIGVYAFSFVIRRVVL